MRRLALFCTLAAALLSLAPAANAREQQRFIMRPGPYNVPQPLPRPQMQPYLGPNYAPGYGRQPAPWGFGHGVMQTCYMIRNGRCYYY